MVLAPPAGSYLTRRWARGPLSVNSDRGTLSYKTKDEGAQERQPRTTGPDPRGQVPNLRGPYLGLYKWKPDLQEA